MKYNLLTKIQCEFTPVKMGGNDPSANSSTSKIQVCIQAELSEKIRKALRNKICTFSSIFDKCCEFSPLANHFF